MGPDDHDCHDDNGEQGDLDDHDDLVVLEVDESEVGAAVTTCWLTSQCLATTVPPQSCFHY